MDYKKLAVAIKLCGSTPKVDQCPQCPYWASGDMNNCIPRVTEDAATAITDLLARAEAAEDRAEKAERERDAYKIFFNEASSKPHCNTCCLKQCEYRPRIGQTTRFNCPLWRGKKEE